MPDPLEALLRSFGNAVAKLFGNIIEWITSFFKNFWAVTLLSWSIVWSTFVYVYNQMEMMWDYLGSIQGQYGNSTMPMTAEYVRYFQFANSIVPITEILAFTVVYLEICTLALLYKFVKSWIPTV
jgi:hypothetical protein